MFIVACLYPQFLKINGDRDEDERRRRRSFSLQSPFFPSLLGNSLKRQRGNLFENLVVRSATLWFIVARWTCTVSRMDSMIKGIYKGFKYTFSQLFVEKEEEEEEMKIGGPTDVKHVAHIGWDGSTETAPSWMNEFKAGNDYAATSISNSGSALSPWSSRDFSEAAMQQSDSDISKDTGSTDHPSGKKKERRKKAKPNTSPKTDASKPSRPGKSKHKLTEDKPKPTNIEVA